MSKSEESQHRFIQAVDHYCKGLTVSPGASSKCDDCTFGMDPENFDEEGADDGNFSRSDCDSCGSVLAGQRYPSHGITQSGDIIHLDICPDCIVYHANGDLPEDWE